MVQSTKPAISIVIGAQNARQSILACLHSLLSQSEAIQVEIIVVDSSIDGTADWVATQFPQVRLLRGRSDALVPHLWKLGLDSAQAPLVAFMTAQCRPCSGWLAQILSAHREDIAAVGGPLIGPISGRGVDWALYLARYSAWLPAGPRGSVNDVAGDNAAYKRAALLDCTAEMQNGFWEVLIHARLIATGRTIVWAPEMQMEFSAAGTLWTSTRARFWHGRYYSSTRYGNTPIMRLLRTLTAPLLLPLLLGRICWRVQCQRPDWMIYVWRALPALSILVTAWSLGEMSGYAWPQQHA